MSDLDLHFPKPKWNGEIVPIIDFSFPKAVVLKMSSEYT